MLSKLSFPNVLCLMQRLGGFKMFDIHCVDEGRGVQERICG